ncbi:MAG: hypothetical protein KAX49_19255 [Halanaerobiales bacterium]|nr:hypothetical protein [Halanaerobiales bacterium]
MSLTKTRLAGFVEDTFKFVFALGKGNVSEAGKILWSTFNNTLNERKEKFEDIFINSLNESIESQKSYLDSKCEGGSELIEKEFLKALSAEGLNFQDVDILEMDEEEFINNLANILKDYLCLPGITTDDTIGICRKLIEELRNKVRNKISQNPALFSKFMLNEVERLGKDSFSMKKELERILVTLNLSEETIHSLLNELATDVKEIKSNTEETNENIKKIMDSTEKLHDKLDVFIEKNLYQIIEKVEQRLKGIKCRDKTIETQFSVRLNKIIGRLKNMDEKQFVNFILSIKIPFKQSESADITTLNKFSIDFLSEVVIKLVLMSMIHPEIEFTYEKAMGLKVDEKNISYIHSNDMIEFDDYEVVIVSFIRELKESQVTHLDKIDRVIVGNCTAEACDGNGAKVDLQYVLEEISMVYPEEEEEFTNFKEKYDFNYHCQKCFRYKTKRQYKDLINGLKRILGG